MTENLKDLLLALCFFCGLWASVSIITEKLNDRVEEKIGNLVGVFFWVLGALIATIFVISVIPTFGMFTEIAIAIYLMVHTSQYKNKGLIKVRGYTLLAAIFFGIAVFFWRGEGAIIHSYLSMIDNLYLRDNNLTGYECLQMFSVCQVLQSIVQWLIPIALGISFLVINYIISKPASLFSIKPHALILKNSKVWPLSALVVLCLVIALSLMRVSPYQSIKDFQTASKLYQKEWLSNPLEIHGGYSELLNPTANDYRERPCLYVLDKSGLEKEGYRNTEKCIISELRGYTQNQRITDSNYTVGYIRLKCINRFKREYCYY